MDPKKMTIYKLRFLLVMSVFGCLGPIVRAIGLPSPVTACLRAWISAAALILYLVISKHPVDKAAFRRALLPMIISGLLIAGDWIGLFNSYGYTTIATSTVCYYIVSVLVFLASPLVLRERFTAKHAVCAAVSFAGMALVAGVVETGLPRLAEMKGILFALLGAVCYASVILINKKYPDGDPIVRTAIQLAVAAIATTPYVLLTTDPAQVAFTPLSILLLLVLGIGLTAVTYILYFYLMVRIPARTVAIFSYADPVVAVLISVFFLSEPITVWGILGSVMIIGSAVISEFN